MEFGLDTIEKKTTVKSVAKTLRKAAGFPYQWQWTDARVCLDNLDGTVHVTCVILDTACPVHRQSRPCCRAPLHRTVSSAECSFCGRRAIGQYHEKNESRASRGEVDSESTTLSALKTHLCHCVVKVGSTKQY